MQNTKGGAEIFILILVSIGAMLFSGLFYTQDESSLLTTEKTVIPVTPSAQITPEKTIQLRSVTFITVTPTVPPPTIAVPVVPVVPVVPASPVPTVPIVIIPTSPFCASGALISSGCDCPSSRDRSLSCTTSLGFICPGSTPTIRIDYCAFTAADPNYGTYITNPACIQICL